MRSPASSVVLIAALASLEAGSALAQSTGSLAGTVTVTGSSRPLGAAQVEVLTVNGARPQVTLMTRTDPDGSFHLNAVPAGQLEVRARLVGYTSRHALVALGDGQSAVVNFSLSRSTLVLDEIVVTGTGGAVERRQLGNTIASINVDDLEAAPVTSFSEMLQAREPSLVGLPSGGLTGEGARIRIRGANSIAMSNEPIVYVDGVRVDGSGGFWWQGGSGPSRLDDINPDAIERIEVLKGAAAATLYGSEANSGVIQVFTKGGRSGRPRFTARIEQGFSRYPDRIKPNAGFARDAEQAARMSELYGETIEPFQVIEKHFMRDLLETGRGSTYAMDVTGGTDDVQYYVAGRWNTENGPIGREDLGPLRDRLRRIQGNANVTLFPRDRLSVRVSTSFADVEQHIPANNNNTGSAITGAQFGKPERASCALSSVDPTSGSSETPVCTGPGNPHGGGLFLTIREGWQFENVQETEHFNGSVNVSYAASAELDANVTFGVDLTNERVTSFGPYDFLVDHPNRVPALGYRDVGDKNNRELTADFRARWTRRVGSAISSQLVVGGQGFVSELNFHGAGVGDFGARGLNTLAAGARWNWITEDFLRRVNAGFYAQEQVGLRDALYLTVGGRWDRNSTFGRSAGAAFYPKASVSFLLTEFLDWGSSTLSTLRLRAAVGESGLQPGAFDKLTTFEPTATTEGQGFLPNNVGNPDLAPERSREIELGGEAGLFDDRVSVDATFWDRITRDALIPRGFPPSGGFTNTQLTNIGRLEAHGWEFKLEALAVDREALAVTLWANAAYLRERVTDMGGVPPIRVQAPYPRHRNSLVEGYAPGTFFGARLIPACGAGIQRTCHTPGQTLPVDVNADGLPDTVEELRAFLTASPAIDLTTLIPLLDDEDGDGDFLDHPLGKPTPDWQGSFGARITLGPAIRINTLFEYRTGNLGVLNLGDAFRRSDAFLGRNVRQAAEVEATLSNPATQTDADARYDAAMTWITELLALAPYSGLNEVEDAKFLRWRELSVSYSFPESFAERLGLSSLAIDGAIRNLHVWTPYSGTDPEGNQFSRCAANRPALDCNFLDGSDAWAMPQPRRFTFTLRVGF